MISISRGGLGEKTFLLLHGLGCTGDVWKGLISIIEDTKSGRWIAPDLRGHGRSEWAEFYSLGHLASDVVPAIKNENDLVIIGHSMGASIGMVLATGIFDTKARSVVAIGPKTDWTTEERLKLDAFAQKSPRIFQTYEEAANRYLLVSGLKGLIDPEDEIVSPAIFHDSKGFRLAADPKTVNSAGNMKSLYRAAQNETKIVLACGEHDNVTNIAELRKMDPTAICLMGLSHNAHVEHPETVWQLVGDIEAIS